MKGKVLSYSVQENKGEIIVENQQYSFTDKVWKGAGVIPKQGNNVDVVMDTDGQILSVLLLNEDDQITRQTKPKDQRTVIAWIIHCFKNYANFSGRAGRKEFWSFYVLYWFLIIMTFVVLDQANLQSKTSKLIFIVVYIILAIPTYAVTCRRLHDIGKSGWYQMMVVLPLEGYTLLLIWCCRKGEIIENRYGKPLE
ncbi:MULTISPECIES: DUF805 domain-containing protein [unclassified Acinetobacter]|uniref:DUF805 domain-containing protein n=1 Tax=unclassified Acinetobacter TaxID=196816 RepID=UPI0035BA0EF4